MFWHASARATYNVNLTAESNAGSQVNRAGRTTADRSHRE
jgi:hypothetical protein